MAKIKPESVEQETETPKAKKNTKTVSVKESEALQKEGWKVVGMSRVDGQRVHTLEKE